MEGAVKKTGSRLAALTVGVVAVGVALPVLANGDSKHASASTSVSVDYSALDRIPATSGSGLLIPSSSGDMNRPIVLHPPSGVKPIGPMQSGIIKLRPPPGVKRAAVPRPTMSGKDDGAPAKKAEATPKPAPR